MFGYYCPAFLLGMLKEGDRYSEGEDKILAKSNFEWYSVMNISTKYSLKGPGKTKI